jgi:Chitobiase/beta-hexosaminidase C-terminal domain/Bacterial Ig domain
VTAAPWKHSPPVGHVQFPSLGTGWTGGGPATTTPYQAVYSFDGSAIEPGAGNNVTVVDTFAGSSLPAPFTVSADATPPTSSIGCNGGACSGGWYASTVSVSLSASDAGSGVAQIRYTTDGSDPSPTNGVTYAGPFPVSSTATIRFRAYDQLGNEEPVGSRSIQIDSSAPSGAITAPAAGATVYGPLVAVSSDSSDTGGSGVAGATFQSAPSGTSTWTTIGADATAPYSVSWSTTGLAAGPYDLRVVTTDNAGNTSTSAIRTVHVPVAFTFKVGKAKATKHGTRVLLSVPVRGSVASTVQATLSRGKKVAFRWRGKARAGARKLKLAIPKGKLKPGRYTLVLLATAPGGRRVQRRIVVKIPKL